MGITIEDGLGTGNMAEVFDNRLRTFSVQDSLMNHMSAESEHQTVFDAQGTLTLASGVTGTSGGVALFVQNNDPTRFLVVDRIYVQVAQQGITLPQASSYFTVGFGRTYTSGGTVITPVNENRFTTNAAVVTTVNSVTLLGLTGTFTEAMKLYPPSTGAAVEIVPQGADSIILTRGNSIEVDFASGIINSGSATAFMRFAMILPGHMG